MKRLLHTLMLVLPLFVAAQEPVDPVTQYYATVQNYHDTANQRIVLTWAPSGTPEVAGYHICTGEPCLDYATQSGRNDTTLFCAGHSPKVPHIYRIHAFDSADNVSALTPPFGPSVLQAEVPECTQSVHIEWTPYIGMPDGIENYTLWMFTSFNQADTLYELCTVDSTGPFAYDYLIPDTIAGWMGFFVQIRNIGHTISSASNTAAARRLTADTARWLTPVLIDPGAFDEGIRLVFSVDTASPAPYFTLYRSVDGDPWVDIAHLTPSGSTQVSYLDADINLYDSAYCYRLGALDGCGLVEKYSDTQCVALPEPVVPRVWIPNALLAGDPDNGLFRPVITGLKGDLYELSIFDRKGLRVFHTTDRQQAWDPAAANAPQGAYVYTLRIRLTDNTIKTHTGTVVVLK